MDHEFYIDRLSAYFDGELKHEEEFMVEEHIKDCPECQKVLEDLRQFDEMVEAHSQLGEDEYWEKSAQKIEAAISGEKTTKVVDVKPKAKSIWLSWKAIGSLATAAVLIFIAVNYVDIQENVEQKTKTSATSKDSSTVDQLLDNAVGVETHTSDSGKGEVFIRGGRAGETSYVVDGVETDSDKEEADKTDNQAEDKIAEEKPALASSAEPAAPATAPLQEKTKKTIVQKSGSVPTKNAFQPVEKASPESTSVDKYMSDLSKSIQVQGYASKETMDEKSDTFVDEQELALAEPELSLEQWRAKADSLTIQLKEFNKRNKSRSGLSNNYKDTSDKDQIIDQYLDCYYQIGGKTEDKEEYLKAVMIIKSYQEGFGETVGVKATETLDKLLALNRFKEE